ncbi:LysR substrate-binding domain-containing protein [Brucella intermedia GD04153]|uniref:LysR substrate-binding domain-containing protein n=1 Tax=Brucella intermedia GD04153 TaxID=2975438 RepID=A0AA42H2U0_9HYPH|nr:LysR substrate-binding domain-containing protein [Brucella intermedia]MDH0127055.1 LysR substrate-binding domain-containing protein [Brucella intermedia GD04153]
MDLRFDANRLPPLQTLQAFSVVAATGSFTAAAEQLNLSQSAVSRQIQQLEHYFGCVLFERHTRMVSITERGMTILPIAEGLLSSFKNSIEASRIGTRSITVRITPTFTRRWLLPRLADLKQLYPDLSINIDTAWFQKPTFGLGDVDVFITYGNGFWPGMDVIHLMEERLTPMCSPYVASDLANDDDLSSLGKQTLIHSNPRQSDWTLWLQAQGAYSFQASSHQVFDTQDFALTAAASGLGVAMGDLTLFRQDIEERKLVTPYSKVVETGYGYYALYPARDEARAKVGDFANWLQSACQPHL